MPSTLHDHPEAVIELSKRDLDEIIESASQRGAKRALEEVGLLDPQAVEDVKELRSLLTVWREVRITALKTAVQSVTLALLGVITLGAAIKLGWLGGVPRP